MIILIISLWILCGIYGYGLTLASFTKQFPYMTHISFAVAVGICGPVGLIVSLCCGGSFKPLFCPKTLEERWAIFYKEHNGYFDREYFERKYS